MPRNPSIYFDPLKLYFGEPHIIDLEGIPGRIVVNSPTIGDVVRIGEKRFYETLNLFICNTTQYRVPLWEQGIDWNEFPDFHLFVMLYSQVDPEVSEILFPGLDFSLFTPQLKQTEEDSEGEIILWDAENEIEINEEVYHHFSQFLRNVFSMFPDEKITQNATLKQWYINKDKRALENAEKKKEQGKEDPIPSIRSLISSCVNHPGFKYKLQELKDVGVCEFYDAVHRLQIYEQSTALLKGMYGGFLDTSKLKPNDYNFMRDTSAN